MDDVKLKPCPFCGAKAILRNVRGRWTVECILGCAGTKLRNDKQWAIETWNRRTEKNDRNKHNLQ